MAAPRRVLRLQQLVLEIVAETLQREVQDPRIGMVSVTRVKLAPDLSAAQVGWSVLGGETVRRTTERGLTDALPLLQRRVAEGLRTRVTPTLTLRFDATMERSQRLETIFERLRAERGEEPGSSAEPAAEGPGEAPDEAPDEASDEASDEAPDEDDEPGDEVP